MIVLYLLTVDAIISVAYAGTVFPVKDCFLRRAGKNNSKQIANSVARHSMDLSDQMFDSPEADYCNDMMQFLPIHLTKHPKMIFQYCQSRYRALYTNHALHQKVQ